MLNKLRVVPIIVLLLTPVVAGFQEAAPWQAFKSPAGKFSMLVPAEPKADVQEVDSEVGKLKLYSFTTSSKAGVLMATYGDYPNAPADAATAEQVLDAVREGVLKSIGAEVISGGRVVLKGRVNSGDPLSDFPGREFSAKKTSAGSETFFNWRVYLVGRRLYQLAVVSSAAEANSPDLQKFLTSFQLID